MGITKGDFDSNMPETIGRIFKVLFDDENWSWTGLANLLVQKYGIVDLGELDNAIHAAIEKEGIKL